MSGLVVACGKPERSQLEAMFRRIRHRGPDVSGIYETKEAIMAQNYLEADVKPSSEKGSIPVASPWDTHFRICYDGQMGNWEELARIHRVSDGPFRDERLLLHLYQQYGHNMLRHSDDAIFAFMIPMEMNYLQPEISWALKRSSIEDLCCGHGRTRGYPKRPGPG